MNTLEDRAAAALTRRAAQARLHADLARVLADAVRPAQASGPTPIGDPLIDATAPSRLAVPKADPSRGEGRLNRRWWVPIATAAALVVGAVGVVVLRHGGSGGPAWGGPSGIVPAAPPAFGWQTPHAALTADRITIEYAGRTLTPPIDATAVSALISADEEELSLRWAEQGFGVLWEISLRMRDGDWWIDAMTVSEVGATVADPNGPPLTPPPWPQAPPVTIGRDSARLPLGEAVGGDIDVAAEASGTTARIQVAGLRILGFRDRIAVDDTAPIEPAPVLPAAPPLAADVAPTGMYPSAQEWMVVTVAREELTRACMAAAGVEYPGIPDDVLIQANGQFQMTAGLSVMGRKAAAATGYRVDNIGYLNGGAHGVPQSLSDEAERLYLASLGNGGSGGCIQEADAVLGSRGDNNPMRAWDVILATGQAYEDVRQQAFDDPNVTAALATWSQCMIDAVGERAANPYELAHLYAFAEGDPTKGRAGDHEKQVAVADFDCQQQVDYVTVWYTAVVARERVAVGDRVGEYDQWVRDYRAMVAAAQQVLVDRGIVLPSLD